MTICNHGAADPEMCIMCLRAERDGYERELEYIASKLMRKGDHSLPEAVDRWVANYVQRSEVDAAWRKGMTDAALLADRNGDWCRCSAIIIAARDSELPTEPKPAK